MIEKVGIGFSAGIFFGVILSAYFAVATDVPGEIFGTFATITATEGVLIGIASAKIKNSALNLVVGALIGVSIYMILGFWFKNFTALTIIGAATGSVTAYMCGLYKKAEA